MLAVCNSSVLSLKATLHSNNRVLGTGREQQQHKLICQGNLGSDLVCLSYENALAFQPVPLGVWCVHTLQQHGANTIQASPDGGPAVCAAGALQGHVICTSTAVWDMDCGWGKWFNQPGPRG